MSAKTTPSSGAPSARPVNEGSAFDRESGKLYRFEAGAAPTIQVMRLWPEPQAWRRHGGGPWRGHRPEIDLRPPGPEGRMRPSIRRWRRNLALAVARIPADVVEVVAPVPSFYRWRALSLVARVDGALDLFRSNPALGAALAYPALFGRPVCRPLRSARRLVKRRRVELLDWLGLPPTRSTERVLRRLPVEDVNPRTLELVCGLLRDGSKSLHHLPRLPAPLLRILADDTGRVQVSGRLIRAVSEAPRDAIRRVADQIKSIRRLQEELRIAERPTLRTEAQVARLLESLVERRRRLPSGRWAVERFPPPPFPEAALERLRLVPSTRPDEFGPLGEELENCLGGMSPSYRRRVAMGTSYIYSVRESSGAQAIAALHLHRARKEGEPWKIMELLGPRNTPVSDGTARAVHAWLDAAQHSSGDWSVVHPKTFTWEPSPSSAGAPDRPAGEPPVLPLGWEDDEIPF